MLGRARCLAHHDRWILFLEFAVKQTSNNLGRWRAKVSSNFKFAPEKFFGWSALQRTFEIKSFTNHDSTAAFHLSKHCVLTSRLTCATGLEVKRTMLARVECWIWITVGKGWVFKVFCRQASQRALMEQWFFFQTLRSTNCTDYIHTTVCSRLQWYQYLKQDFFNKCAVRC